jgi:MoxR-like ATPase
MNQLLQKVVSQLNQIILGKDDQIKLAITCLLAKGHLLIEDLPGMGKTTLAHALAKTLGLDFQRVQFTNDLLPADIIGTNIFNASDSSFVFHQGPVFTQVLLADEINRATPKSQSALLEAMEEGQVTSDGTSRELPQPFFVIATQNPFNQAGTYPLPESQLDRFLMCLSLGYPDSEVERSLLLGKDTREQISNIVPVINSESLAQLQIACQSVNVTDKLIDYLQVLIKASRDPEHFQTGLSPRASIGLLTAAKAWAYLTGRDYVLPEDIQAVWSSVASHRLMSGFSSRSEATGLATQLLQKTAIPR